jgi:hypothetical protein
MHEYTRSDQTIKAKSAGSLGCKDRTHLTPIFECEVILMSFFNSEGPTPTSARVNQKLIITLNTPDIVKTETYDDTHTFSVEEGALFIEDVDADIVCVYAPGTWTKVKFENA